MDAERPELIALPSLLAGERVVVRPYRPGDGAAVFEAVDQSRAHLDAWMPWTHHHGTTEDTEAWVRRAAASWAARQDLPAGMFDGSGRFLGGLGLHRFDWRAGRFEIGYWVRADEIGRGYVTEAVRLLTALCFARLEANRVEIHCDARNVRSAAVAERLGFVAEGTLSNYRRDHHGALADERIFAHVPETFAATPWAAAARAAVDAADWDG